MGNPGNLSNLGWTRTFSADLLQTLKKHGAVIEAFVLGAEVEYKNRNGNWQTTEVPLFDKYTEYRVKPPEPALEIPWDLLPKEFNYAAMDQDGLTYIFRKEPRFVGKYWAFGYQRLPLLNLNPRNVPWEKSLTVRPGVSDD